MSSLVPGTKETRTINEAKALDMRLSGYTYPEIAAAIGYKNADTAHAAVQRAIKAIHIEPVLERITMAITRYETMMAALWPRILDGDPVAIREGRALQDSLNRLEGLNAPDRVVTVTLTLDQRAQALVDGGYASTLDDAREIVQEAIALSGKSPG
jgi:hypothetical protein